MWLSLESSSSISRIQPVQAMHQQCGAGHSMYIGSSHHMREGLDGARSIWFPRTHLFPWLDSEKAVVSCPKLVCNWLASSFRNYPWNKKAHASIFPFHQASKPIHEDMAEEALSDTQLQQLLKDAEQRLRVKATQLKDSSLSTLQAR